MSVPVHFDLAATLAAVDAAAAAGKLTAGAVANIKAWLSEPRYHDYAPDVAAHVADGKWQALDDVFWTIIPFGTGGRRGKMYPIGSNAINDRTIGESAQGLADYIKQAVPGPHSCAIAYDTRHRSRDFAELCAGIMAANGFKVYFMDGYRSTPSLSVAVRHKHCSCGIMVTASHNPPSDNAVKAYWSTGGQLLPPHDTGVIERVMSTQTILRIPFAEALESGKVEYCQDEVDTAYQAGMKAQSLGGPRDLRIVYSPMHGVGASSVMPILAAVGFRDVELFGPHATPDGDFPNVPGHVSNPENPATFDSMITRAKEAGADIVLSTDPDADRLGCAAPLVPGGEWKTFTGNQIAALLAEYVLSRRKASGLLSPEHYLIKTIVTTEMIRRIGTSYGVATHGDLMVGFKWIGGLMDVLGPAKFVLGTEESHGYLVGDYARDKDAAVAAMLLAELAAETKANKQTLHQKLEALFWQHGVHAEKTVSKTMPGSEGMARMREIMARLRTTPPRTIADQPVMRVRDYEQRPAMLPGQDGQPVAAPPGDVIVIYLKGEGNFVAVRPSGTEPKVKFYLFAYEPPELLANLPDAQAELAARLAAMERDLSAYVEA
ncbi:MAG: phospho-sugar mutase [Pirellulales bacterium]